MAKLLVDPVGGEQVIVEVGIGGGYSDNLRSNL